MRRILPTILFVPGIQAILRGLVSYDSFPRGCEL